jgi:phosphatidylserine decarboxylase
MGSKAKTLFQRTSRLGGWVPHDPEHFDQWLNAARRAALKRQPAWHPVIHKFRALIEDDPLLYMYFTRMFEEQPKRQIRKNWGDVKLKNYAEMLHVLNYVLKTAPEYNHTGMVGFPINAILDYPMITPAGLAAFTDPRVNAMLRAILTVWARFLDSPKSRYVLSDCPTGWLCADAWKKLKLDEYESDPAKPYHGFRSWNDFFIRRLKPGVRPVAGADDSKIIVSACESQPFSIKRRVKARDEFWLKSQPYSLTDMLAGAHVEHFVGGTVYQAFLCAKNYHRWHSPVAGTIRKLKKIPGTYYAEVASEHFDQAGPNNSQGYIAHVATRALMFIEADDPGIGLMCVVTIGMAEVSSCIFEAANGRPLREGQHVDKGDQLGFFQFGGSTHCLVFGPQVALRFVREASPKGLHGCRSAILKVNSHLATVR